MTSRSIFSIPMLCAAVGLTAISISGCDEVDQMADNAAKRPANASGVGVVTDADSTNRQPKQAAPADTNNQAATAPRLPLNPIRMRPRHSNPGKRRIRIWSKPSRASASKGRITAAERRWRPLPPRCRVFWHARPSEFRHD